MLHWSIVSAFDNWFIASKMTAYLNSLFLILVLGGISEANTGDISGGVAGAVTERILVGISEGIPGELWKDSPGISDNDKGVFFFKKFLLKYL